MAHHRTIIRNTSLPHAPQGRVNAPRPSAHRPPLPAHTAAPDGAPPVSPGARGRTARRRPRGGALRRFLSCERGNVAIESALAIAILVGAFAVLMNTVGTVFDEDRTGRGVRAVARALALDPNASPWAVLEREVGGLDSAQCPAWTSATERGSCGGWTLAVSNGISPGALGDALGGGTAAEGEMIFVRVLEPGSAGLSVSVVRDANAQDADGDADSGASDKVIAIGLARREPAL